MTVRRLPWGVCHIRGQDLLALGVSRDALIVDSASRLQLQRVTPLQAKVGNGGTSGDVAALGWCDHRGALALLWESGLLCVLENPSGLKEWDAVDWTITAEAVQPEAQATVCWSAHSLLVAVAATVTVYAFADDVERKKYMPSPPALRHQQSVALPFSHLAASLCPNGAYIATSYIDQPVVHVWCGKGRAQYQEVSPLEGDDNDHDYSVINESSGNSDNGTAANKRPTSARQRRVINTPLATLPHTAPAHVVEWRGGLPGVLPMLMTACGADDHVHIWAEGKASTPMDHSDGNHVVSPTGFTTHEDPGNHHQPPTTHCVTREQSADSEPPVPVDTQVFGLWVSIGPFAAAGAGVTWLKWANFGSTKASQHLASRVRHHGFDHSSGGSKLLKTIAGTWILGLESNGTLRLWCVLNQHNPPPGEPRLPDQPEVVEVSAPASWKAWKASSFGAFLDHGDVGSLRKDVVSSAEARVRGPQIAATGFFDPRGVGVPAEIALVFKPDFLRDSRKLLLTTLGTSLARDGDLRLHCICGSAVDSRLLAFEEGPGPSSIAMHPQHLHSSLRSPHTHSDDNPHPQSSASALTSPTAAPMCIHPTLPFIATKAALGTVIRTAFLPHTSYPLYTPPSPISLPIPLTPIRLPEGRTAEFLLWVHDASGLEKSPPCLLVLDSDKALFLYQAQRHETTLPEPDASATPRHRGATLASTASGGFECAVGKSTRTLSSASQALGLTGVSMSQGSGGMGVMFYEVNLRPDPVYGLGMRLEKREGDILVASFKRHPHTDGLLPAEASGFISVGDALVGANGYSLAGMELEQAVGVMRTVGVSNTGEVSLRFRRLTAPFSTTGDGSRTRRVPSIYGIDFIGASGRGERLDETMSVGEDETEQPLASGQILKWNLCGRGLLSGERWDAATLLPLDNHDYDFTMPTPSSAHASSATPSSSSEAPREAKRGVDNKQWIRVAVLVGCAGRRLAAYDVMVNNGALRAVEMVSWEGEWAVGSLVFLSAYQALGHGFIVIGIDGGGVVWRWSVLRDHSLDANPKSTTDHPAHAPVPNGPTSTNNPSSNDTAAETKASSSVAASAANGRTSERCVYRVGGGKVQGLSRLQHSEAFSAAPGDYLATIHNDLNGVSVYSTDPLGIAASLHTPPQGPFVHSLMAGKHLRDIHLCASHGDRSRLVLGLSHGTRSQLFEPTVGKPATSWPLLAESPALPGPLPCAQLRHVPSLVLHPRPPPLHDAHPHLVIGLQVLSRVLPAVGSVMKVAQATLAHVLGIIESVFDPQGMPPRQHELVPGLWDIGDDRTASLGTQRIKSAAEKIRDMTSQDHGGGKLSGLPHPLSDLSPADALALWALLDALRTSAPASPKPSFNDQPLGSAALLAFDIRRSLLALRPPAPTAVAVKFDFMSSNDGGEGAGVGVGGVDTETQAAKQTSYHRVCASAVPAALFADESEALVDYLLPKGDNKLEWDAVRDLYVPLWCRSLAPLKRLAEELAVATFRRTQSPIHCAMLYMAAGKKSTLRALARTSKDPRRSLDKLMQHDLASQRGKLVMEKNAFHLLRNRNYEAAAAVFLLPEPPLLDMALDVIVRHLDDPMLALFVCRLIEGGMYPSAGEDDAIGPLAYELIERDVVPWARAEGGGALEAAAHMWIGKPESAIEALFRGDEGKKTHETALTYEQALARTNGIMDSVLSPMVAAEVDPSMALSWRAMAKAVAAAGQVEGLELLTLELLDDLTECTGAEHETAMAVMAGRPLPARDDEGSRASRHGGASTRGFDSVFGKGDDEHGVHVSLDRAGSGGRMNGGGAFSIFDQFDVQPPPASAANTQPSMPQSSSIFDAYDVPSKAHTNQQQQPASSDIFSAWDVPQPAPSSSHTHRASFDSTAATSPQSQTLRPSSSMSLRRDRTQSSRRPSAKTPTSNDTGLGTGDIFAQFDAPQPQPPRDPEPDDGLMGPSGGMFDQHDAHGSISTLRRRGSVLQGRLTSTVQMATDSGLGAGDIFAQFDAPPPTPSHHQQEQQASSIFDQYDVPKGGGGGGGGIASTTYTPDTGLGTGGVFDQYDAAPTPGWGATQLQPGSMAEPVDDGEIEVCYVTTTVEYDDETLMEFQKGPLRDLSLWCIDTRIMVAASRLVRETEALLWTWQAYNPLVQSDPSLASVFPLDPDPPSLPLTDHCAGIAKSLSTQHNLPHHALLSAALRRCPALAVSAAAREDQMAPPRYPLALRALFLQMLDRHATLDMLIRSAARRILVQCCTLARPLTATEPPTDHPPLCPSLTRSLVSVAWDLETCTFLHIMGAVQLSPWTLAEAAVGARMALVLTSWRQNYPALQILATHPPHTNLVSGVPSCTALEEEEQAPLPPVGVVLDQARSHSCDVTDVTGTESDAEVDPLSQLAAAVTAIASSGSGNEADGSSSGGGARGQHTDVDGAMTPGTERRRRSSSSWKPSMNDIQRLKSLAFDRVRSLPEMAKAGRATSTNHHTSSSGPASHHPRAHHHDQDDSGDQQQQRRHGASEGELEKLDGKKDQGQALGQRIYEHTAGMGGGHPSSADQHRPGQFTVQEGWEQYQECTRTEAEAELASKPPGSFILRPKGNNLDVVLTVRTSDLQSGGGGGRGGIRVGGHSQPQAQMYSGSSSSSNSHNSHYIRHFVIRVIPPSTSGAPPAFRCGSLGPYPDLEELLFEISSCLDVGLRLHWSRRRTMGDDASLSASEGIGDGRSSEWPWQQTYLSLSPNGTLFRSLAQHAHLTLTSLDDNGASPTTPTDPSVPCPLRHVIDLLALRAVLRQCCDLLRSKQQTSGSLRPPTSSSNGSSACALDADDPSDELRSFFRVVFEPEAIFMGPLARPPAINSEGLAGSASSGLLAPLTRWVDVLERQLQAWLAPRIAFRPPREERERLYAMLKAASEPATAKSHAGYGDRVLRIMMREDCDVPFHNLRVGMGPRTAQVVCFQAADAAGWMVKHGYEPDVASAKQTLSECEAKRVIQRVRGAGDDDRYGVYYRYIDPWQVDPHLDGPVGVLSEGIVGRMAVEPIRAGEAVHIPELERLGSSVQALWSSLRGDAWVKETVALAVPPLEREAGPTCRPDSSVDAFNTDMTEAYTRAITRHLYRNVLFSRVQLPYRFMALIQADLTDLRQVVPVGTAQHPRHMDVYAIIKLKRKAAPLPGSGIAMPAPVTARNRTIDTVITDNVRAILQNNAHGSSAEDKEPSLPTALNATFRFALPDECAPSRGLEAVEWLSKGPPRVMHIFVYEKRTIMADTLLGDVEVALAQLTEEDFLDQWIPLRNPSGHRQSVTWLVRVQVLLSFLLMRVRDVDGAIKDAEASALADDMMRPSADLGYDDEVRVSMMLDDIG